MEISVIMPVYNETYLLQRSIESVRNQTFTDWELIIIDDGSTKDILPYCIKYLKEDKRIRLYRQKHAGQATARNRGLDLAKGRFISFADSDDYMHPQMLEQLHRDIMSTDTKIATADFASVRKLPVMKECHYSAPAIWNVMQDSSDLQTAVRKDNVYLWNKLFDRSLFQEICFPKGRFYEDTAVMHLLLDKAGKVAVNSNVLYYYYHNPRGTVHTFDERKIRDCLWAHEERIHFYYTKNYENDLHHVTHAFLYKAYELYARKAGVNDKEKRQISRKIRKKVRKVFRTYHLEKYLPLHGKIRYGAFIIAPWIFEAELGFRPIGRKIIYSFCKDRVCLRR